MEEHINGKQEGKMFQSLIKWSDFKVMCWDN